MSLLLASALGGRHDGGAHYWMWYFGMILHCQTVITSTCNIRIKGSVFQKVNAPGE